MDPVGYPFTHPLWYVFMTAVLAAMVAMILCYGLLLGIRTLVARWRGPAAQGGPR